MRARCAGSALRLVGDQDDRLADRAQHLGEMPVERRHAGAGVDQEQADVGRAHGGLGLGRIRPARLSGRGVVEAGGVDGGELEVAEPRLALAPVAGDARAVVDQRQPPADQPVEQRRLADIRPADDGDAERAMPRGIERATPERVYRRSVRPERRYRRFGGAGVRRSRRCRRPAAAGLLLQPPSLAPISASISWARWRTSSALPGRRRSRRNICGRRRSRRSRQAARPSISRAVWRQGLPVAARSPMRAFEVGDGWRCRRGARRRADAPVSSTSAAALLSVAIASNSATAPALSPACAFSAASRKRARTG